MTIYRYVCIRRPPAPGAIPKDGLREAHQKVMVANDGRQAYGHCDYTRPLNQAEIDDYELEFLLSFTVEGT